MHENREISWTSWSADQNRSAKAINRTADVNVQEKSDCAVVPVNPNKEGQPSAEAGEGRAQTKENIVQSHMRPTQSGKRMSQGLHGVRQSLPLLIHRKSRTRKRARTDLRGGRSPMVVPTATVIRASQGVHNKTVSPKSGVKFSVFVQIGPKIDICFQNLCSSR
jgi:hypothetical protein